MTMKENPYSKFLELTKQKNDTRSAVLIGEVISPTPLTVSIGDLQIDGDDILIADYLLIEHERSYSTDRSDPVWSDVGKMRYEDGLVAGDRLAILPTANGQLYIIVARVRGL